MKSAEAQVGFADPLQDASVPLLFEESRSGRVGFSLPADDVEEQPLDLLLPGVALRSQPPALPELSEGQIVRHFTKLAHANYSVDEGFYPLGSCTMKYNPKIDDALASLDGFTALHPLQPLSTVSGTLAVCEALQRALAEISGMDCVSLHPAAGAHGELGGLLVIRAYHEAREPGQRSEVLIPNTAHGTNPASAAMAGYRVVEVPTDTQGNIDLESLKRLVGPQTAALMLTNPNTLGLFEQQITEVTACLHHVGALVYYDGANMNAILGVARPREMGFDVVHLNLHKTFATPHGGGGPGAGALGVRDFLIPYLPGEWVERNGEGYRLVHGEASIGRLRAFFGNVANLIRALVYIRCMGAEGLRHAAETAVLNANYLLTQVRELFSPAYDRSCMHEFVVSAAALKQKGVKAIDVAKRLLDYGFYAPTIYFPLNVAEALMIEPTETESKATLDAFAEALRAIVQEAQSCPQVLHEAPHRTPVGRLDEVAAARHPKLVFSPDDQV